MKKIDVTLKDVQDVYSGPEGLLWELIMGEQIHVGGFNSSLNLAKKAGIKEGMKGIDLCSALGAGCRFLVNNFNVQMCGLDATETMHNKAIKRVKEEGLDSKIELKIGDVTNVPYDDETFDFVWGEDAWCYVEDKEKLIEEAARILKPEGILSFTDWIEGSKGLADDEAERINRFMKFPYMESIESYKNLMTKNRFEIIEIEDITEEFADYIDFYVKMLSNQLMFDALKIIGNDIDMFKAMGEEMMYMAKKAHEGKFGRGRFIAKKL